MHEFVSFTKRDFSAKEHHLKYLVLIYFFAETTTKTCHLRSRTTLQGSISLTFYKQLLQQYSCAEKLQSQTASIKSFWRKNIGAKAARKMLMKLTPVFRVGKRPIFGKTRCQSNKINLI